MTKSNWQKLGKTIIIWLFVEILLNFLGIDDLADYSEFIVLSKEHELEWEIKPL